MWLIGVSVATFAEEVILSEEKTSTEDKIKIMEGDFRCHRHFLCLIIDKRAKEDDRRTVSRLNIQGVPKIKPSYTE